MDGGGRGVRSKRTIAAVATAAILSFGLMACSAEESGRQQLSAPTPAPSPGGSLAPVPTPAAPPPEEPSAPAPERPPTPTDTSEPAGSARVTRIVDGDTVEARRADGTTMTVRILGIDTPEVHSGVECWGPESSAFARRILSGASVLLQSDPTQSSTDRYGRALRYVTVAGESYSVLAAEAGAARSSVYGGTPVQQHPQVVAAEQRARDASRGLWGPPCLGTEQTPEPTSEQTPEPTLEPVPAPVPEQVPEPTLEPPEAAGDCAPGYSPCVPPSPPDLDCADLDGPISVSGDDPHRLDGDDDGVGCE